MMACKAYGTARAGHMMHGTTRQVLSLITNPLDVMCANLQTVRGMMNARPDILGAHLEGPFLALSRKGAHDPECLKDPVPEYVDRLLQAANGCFAADYHCALNCLTVLMRFVVLQRPEWFLR